MMIIMDPRGVKRLCYLALLLALLPAAAVAQTANELSATEQRLQALRSQIAEDERLLSETARAEQASMETLNDLDRELALRGELTSTYQLRLTELTEESDSLRKAMDSFSDELSEMQTEYRRYAIHAYKYGRLHDLALILSAESINQMLIRIRYLNRFADQRRSKLQSIRDAATALEDRRARLAEARVKTQLLLQEAEQERMKMQRLQQSRRGVIDQLRTQRTTLQEDLTKKRQAATALEARMRELITAADARRRESTARNPNAEIEYGRLSGSFMQNRGHLPWPAQGVVVEPFGDIVNPVHGTKTPNPGVLIATKPQEEVHAIFDGTVLSVSVLPEFGTFVAVQHGEYQSVYSNFSMIYVAEGTQVTAGQILGRAGTDAEPKQAGIFFGLFKNGVPFDPTPWLRPR